MGPIVAALLIILPAVHVESKVVDAIDYRDVLIDVMVNPLLLGEFYFPYLELTGLMAPPQSQEDISIN